MELSRRIKYFTFLILGVIFLLSGFALSELDVLSQINHDDLNAWYEFLAPWVGNPAQNGLPVPWDQ